MNQKITSKHQKKLNDGFHELDWKARWININKGRVTSMDERRGKTIKYDIGGVKFCDNFFKNIISYDTLKELASYKEEDKHYQKLQQ